MAVQKLWKVGVVGALGMVGREMIRTLERRCFPLAELVPLDLPANEGAEVDFAGEKLRVRAAAADNFSGLDIALFSAGGDASLKLAPQAVARGVVVIDNSSAWRMAEDCPLVVPEVNPEELREHRGIIANPNCSTIQMVAVLKPLHDYACIRRIVVSTYQAVSGAGMRGVAALEAESRSFLQAGDKDGLEAGHKGFQYRIAFNLLPQIDVFQEGGYTKEEVKMIQETRKIMADTALRITATCVRVPVFYGHSESVNIETEREIKPETARRLLRAAPGITVIDDPDHESYPMPIMSDSEDATMVGRIRKDCSVANGLNLWIVSNNIRKGAALNAVQIAELLVESGLVTPKNRTNV
jgi:aspartate-semialdehyde dehydrogenase